MFFTPAQICIIGLILVAALVSVLQIKQQPKKAWPWIVVYWILLTIKNIFDLAAGLL